MAEQRTQRRAPQAPVDHDEDLELNDYINDELPPSQAAPPAHELDDDLPDEMDDNSAEDHPSTLGTVTTGLTLEELNQRTLDDQRDEAERAKIDPPRGDWLKDDRFKYEIRSNGADRMPGDFDPSGRTIINVSGYPHDRVVDGQTYRPMLFMRFSPDIRYKQDDPTKHDNAYKMWLFARDLYLEINGRKAHRIGDIISMLEDEEYLITTMKGDNGPVAIGLKHRDYLKRRNRRTR